MADVIRPKFSVVDNSDTVPETPIDAEDIFIVGDVKADDFDKLPIPDIAYGQNIVGTLTDEETARFVVLDTLRDRFDRMCKDLTVVNLEAASKSLRGFATVTDYLKAMQSGTVPEHDISDDDMERMSRMEMLINRQHTHLMYDIRQRLGIFRFNIGIRSKRRVVTIGVKQPKG